MLRRLSTLALAAALSTAPACSVLFDPSQYRTTDVASGGTFDAGRPDAYVPPGVDADLDAWEPDAWEPDAWMPDAWAPDANLDAWAPDAFVPPPTCPEAGSLSLPTCGTPSALTYCLASDPTMPRALDRAVAEAVLPDGRAYRLGLLGNGIEVVSAEGDAIVDHEIVRDGNTVAIVWAESGARGALRRQLYTVGEPGLVEAGAVQDYDLTGLGVPTITDLSMAPTNTDTVWVGYTGGTADGGVGECGPSSGCRGSALGMRPLASPVWVANAGADVVGGFYRSSPSSIELAEIGGMGSANQGTFDAAHVTGLRSTAARLVYTTGAVGAGQFAFEVSGLSAIGTISIGGDRARLTQAEGGFLQGQVRGAELEIATTFGACGASCDCTSCRGPGLAEVQVPRVSEADLVDWTFDNVDQYFRVAVLLYGDSGGTNVAAVMWDVRTGLVRVEPLVFASGRGAGGPGLGRSIRTVVERSDTRLEVFVSTVVGLPDLRDHIFLSGFRLERCSS